MSEELTDDQSSFLLAQYNAIRTEIIERMKLDQSIQRNAVILMTAFYTVAFGGGQTWRMPAVAFLLPVIVAAVSYVQQRRFKQWAFRMGLFIKALETEILSGLESSRIKRVAWEHFVEAERGKENRQISDFLRDDLRSTRVFSSSFIENALWSALLVGAIVVFVVQALL